MSSSMIFSAFTRSVQRFREDRVTNITPDEMPRLLSHSINLDRLLFSDETARDGLSTVTLSATGKATSLFAELLKSSVVHHAEEYPVALAPSALK